MSELFRNPYRYDHRTYDFAVNDTGHVDVVAEDAQGNKTRFKMSKNEGADWKIINGAGLPGWVYEAELYLAAHLDGEL